MNTEIKRISYDDTKPFLLNIHYARRMPCIQYAFGMFENDKLIGVCTFGQPASPFLCKGVAGEEFRKNVIELNRLCFLPTYNGNNRASKLVSASLKQLPPRMFVVSYADVEGWGHNGYIYQATNFMYTGKTKSRTDKFSEGHSRHYDANTTKRSYRTSKHRYIYITGSKSDKRFLKKHLNYPVFNWYPKGDNVNYDTDNPTSVCEAMNDYENSKSK